MLMLLPLPTLFASMPPPCRRFHAAEFFAITLRCRHLRHLRHTLSAAGFVSFDACHDFSLFAMVFRFRDDAAIAADISPDIITLPPAPPLPDAAMPPPPRHCCFIDYFSPLITPAAADTPRDCRQRLLMPLACRHFRCHDYSHYYFSFDCRRHAIAVAASFSFYARYAGCALRLRLFAADAAVILRRRFSYAISLFFAAASAMLPGGRHYAIRHDATPPCRDVFDVCCH